MNITWRQLNSRLKGAPTIGQFELTTRCNLRCKMCYVCQSATNQAIKSRERTAGEWIRLAEEARDAGLINLLLTGGEVFLREDFLQIYHGISRMGILTEIYTNGTLITPEIARELGNNPPLKVEVTLYGASPDTYRKVCGCADGFERTLRGIDLLLAEGIDVEMKTTVIRENAGEFDRMAELADERGINFAVVNYVTPRRDGAGNGPTSARLQAEQLVQYEIQTIEYALKKENKAPDIIHPECLAETPPVWKPDENSAFPCEAGKSAFWVMWDGRMTPCALMDRPETFPMERGFAVCWEELRRLTAAIPAAAECRQCPIQDTCMTCPARLHNETGAFDKSAPYLCDTARERQKYREWFLNEECV